VQPAYHAQLSTTARSQKKHLLIVQGQQAAQAAEAHLLHHGQVLQVFMSLKQGIPGSKLHKDAATAPQVTGVAPAQTQDHLVTASQQQTTAAITQHPQSCLEQV
jgi:hypothetical protein